MDAQVAWDPLGSCSCWHGVTSVVMGNCGFALAPCKPEDREWFARCLTAVEDIPTEAMMEGIDWTWETFPEYLANVERLPKGLNYGMYLGHSALRMYAMGKRGLEEKANEDDLRAMEHAVAEALKAGALGFSTSRATTHVTPDDTPVASRIADWSEIERLVAAMGALDTHLPDRARHLGRRGAACLPPAAAQDRARHRPPDHVRHARDQAGHRPQPVGFSDPLHGRDRGARRPDVRPSDDPLDQRGVLAALLPAVRRAAGLEGGPRAALGRAEATPARTELRARLIAEEATTKPRERARCKAAAVRPPTRVRSALPDYDNLFPMLSVDWDDPSVGDLVLRRITSTPV